MKYVIFIVLLLHLQLAQAQAPELVFDLFFFKGSYFIGKQVFPTKDGGFYTLTSSKMHTGQSPPDYTLEKYDKVGKQLFTKYLGSNTMSSKYSAFQLGANYGENYLLRYKLLADDGFYYFGNPIGKVFSSGQIAFERKNNCYELTQVNDGSYVGVGSNLFEKIDSLGNVLISTKFDKGIGFSNHANFVTETRHGDYIFMDSGVFSRISHTGELHWQRQVPGEYAFKELSDGSFLVLSNNEAGKKIISKIFSDGHLDWTRFFENETQGLGIKFSSSDGNWFVYTQKYILKISPFGQIIWEKTIENIKSLLTTADGGCLFVSNNLRKWDAQGNQLWQIDLPNVSSNSYELFENTKGQYIVTCFTEQILVNQNGSIAVEPIGSDITPVEARSGKWRYSVSSNNKLTKTNKNGEIQWQIGLSNPLVKFSLTKDDGLLIQTQDSLLTKIASDGINQWQLAGTGGFNSLIGETLDEGYFLANTAYYFKVDSKGIIQTKIPSDAYFKNNRPIRRTSDGDWILGGMNTIKLDKFANIQWQVSIITLAIPLETDDLSYLVTLGEEAPDNYFNPIYVTVYYGFPNQVAKITKEGKLVWKKTFQRPNEWAPLNLRDAKAFQTADKCFLFVGNSYAGGGDTHRFFKLCRDIIPQKISLSASNCLSQGGAVTLQAHSDEHFSYQWYKDNKIIAGATSSSYLALQAGNYYVRIQDNQCKLDDNTETVVIKNSSSLPLTAQLSGDAGFCSGGTANVRLSISGGVAPYHFEWTHDKNATTTNVSVSQAGQYVVNVRDNDGCIIQTNAFDITQKELPKASISAPDIAVIYNSKSITINTKAKQSSSYQWFENNNPIPNTNSPNFEAKHAGNYSVAVTQDGCTATSRPVFIEEKIVEETLPEIHISPNPAQEAWSIQVKNMIPETLTLKLFDVSGRLVSQTSYTEDLVHHIVLPSEFINAGIYLLQIQTESYNVTKKLIKL